MINIKIAENPYQIPSSLLDVKLSRWIEYIDFLTEHQPEFLQPEIDDDGNYHYKKLSELEKDELLAFYDFQCKELAFWTGCEYKLLRRFELSEVGGLWGLLQEKITPIEDKGFSYFECGGDIYYCPKRLMFESTLQDYAEANEYERQLEQVENGSLQALFYVCAVICRKEGEQFDDYNVNRRAAFFKEHLTAYDAMQVGFFLQRLSEKSLSDFQIYSRVQALKSLKQVSKG